MSTQNEAGEYTCEMCKRTFEKAWSDEEAAAEYATTFDEEHQAGAQTDTVCHDCWNWMFDENGKSRPEHHGQKPPWTKVSG